MTTTITAPAPTSQASELPDLEARDIPLQDDPRTIQDEDLAAEAAEAVYREFHRLRSAIGQHPDTDLDVFEVLAVEPALSLALNGTVYLRSHGARQVGTSGVRSLVVDQVDLHSDPPDQVPTVVLHLCEDVSGVDVIGPDGASIVEPGLPDRFLSTVRIAYFGDYGGWHVGSVESEGETC